MSFPVPLFLALHFPKFLGSFRCSICGAEHIGLARQAAQIPEFLSCSCLWRRLALFNQVPELVFIQPDCPANADQETVS